MKLDFPVVIEALIKAKGVGFSQHLIIDGIYRFIGEQDPTYYVEPISEAYASNVKKRKENVRKKIVEGAYVPRIISSMPRHVQNEILPILKVEKCRGLVDNLLSVIRSDSQIGLTARERMEMTAADPTMLHVFLAEVIIYALQQSNADPKDAEQAEPIVDAVHEGKIVSFVVPPVSKENYVARPDIERDISQALHTNKITVIRGLSGLGKSELARKVATDETGFSTIIRLELGNDGSGDFDRLLETYVTVVDVPKDKTQLQCIKSILEKASSDTLVTVDNLNDIENRVFLQNLITLTGNAKILITSQIQKEKLDTFFQKCKVSAGIIDLEATKYEQEAFAPMVFCSYAGLSYGKLTIKEQSGVRSICNHVENHTMIIAALGARLQEYGDGVNDILSDLENSVRDCLQTDLSVEMPKDFDDYYLTPYEILKKLFGKVLSRKFTEYERQVLGAVILLPTKYRSRHELEELVGDLKEVPRCSFAKSAVNKLVRDGILDMALVLYPGVQKIINEDATRGIIHSREYLLENSMAKEELALHPLYIQLFSDPEIRFYDKTGIERQGPIAELSIDFALHLLNNRFVSPNIPQWHDYLKTYREMGEHMGLSDPRKQQDASAKNKGWIAALEFEFTEQERADILSAIKYNHKLLNCEILVSDNELLDIFGYIPEEEEHEGWYLSIPGFLTEEEPGESTEAFASKPPWEPKHPSLFVVAEGPYGSTLWVVDHVTKKEYCILNLCNQRKEAYRYFGVTEQSPASTNELNHATLVDVMGNAQYLHIPSHIGGNIPITTVHYGGLGRCGTQSVKMVCFPETVTRINQRLHWLNAVDNDPVDTRVVFLGKSISIGRCAFRSVPWASTSVILPEKQVFLEYHSLATENMDHIVVPFGTEMEIVLPEFLLFAYLDMEKTNILMLPHKDENVFFETEEIFTAMKSEHWDSIEVYDQTKSVVLHWDSLFEFLYQRVGYLSERLRIGIDFYVNQNGNILFSKDKLQAQPWLDINRIRYLPAISKACRVYTRNANSNMENVECHEDGDIIYTADITKMLHYCINEAHDCIQKSDSVDAHTLLQIANDLLAAKAELLPYNVDDVREQIDNLLIQIR